MHRTVKGLKVAAMAAVLVVGLGVIASAADKVTTIVLTGGTEDNIRAMLPLFEKQHPDIKVNYQPTPEGEDYSQKLLVEMAANAGPDVFLLDNPYIPMFADKDLALDLNKVATQYSVPIKKYPKYVLDIFTRQGKVLALPKGFTPIVTFYNKDIFANRGVTEPVRNWTWNDWLAKAKKLTQDVNGDGTPEIWGTNFSDWDGYFVPEMWSWGADLVDPTGTTAQGYANSPKMVQFMEFVKSWVTSGAAPTAAQADAIQGGFLTSGKGAMAASGHWAMYGFRENLEKGAYHMGVMHLPIGPYNTQPTTVIYSTGWSVWTGSKHQKEAVELVKFLGGVDYERKEALETLVEIPGHQDVIQEMLKTDKYDVEQEMVYASQFGQAPWGSRIQGFPQGDYFAPAISKIWRENAPIQNSLENAARQLDAWLGENVRNKK